MRNNFYLYTLIKKMGELKLNTDKKIHIFFNVTELVTRIIRNPSNQS